ncbi:MAG: DUF5690 family protein [Tannerellaceae bacterium]|nr:DUF5690 family protein [Tannerellaceae bacterium]
MNTIQTVRQHLLKKIPDLLFILWAGGGALLAYSMVYALRKPFTAAAFEGLEIGGMDYKVVVTIIQVAGYVLSKFAGIRIVSELKKEQRLTYIILLALLAQGSLVLFGLLPMPFNVAGMFLNGLSLGCMWGIIFSFLEGRRLTDILASLMGISIVLSSGTAKSAGLYVMNTWQVSECWMPALIGGIALPVLVGLGYLLNRLPEPTPEDIAGKTKRETLNGQQRRDLFKSYFAFLTILLVANVLLVILRDIKEDFLVNIMDVSGYSSWLFARIDSIVTVIILVVFGLMVFIRDNLKALLILLGLISAGMILMSYISFQYHTLRLNPVLWLFLQSLCLYLGYLSFQTIFFDRFIACFKIRGNVGFFIALNDFLGYAGTVVVLVVKEFFNPEVNWLDFYNLLSAWIGVICTVAFIYCMWYLNAKPASHTVSQLKESPAPQPVLTIE